MRRKALQTALEKSKKAMDDNAEIAALRSVKEELEQAYGQACQCKPESAGSDASQGDGRKKGGDDGRPAR